tara:strand:- start:227 stop:1333 length:1107 start_codon:yes stop_codon:yes gene_type:complete
MMPGLEDTKEYVSTDKSGYIYSCGGIEGGFNCGGTVADEEEEEQEGQEEEEGEGGGLGVAFCIQEVMTLGVDRETAERSNIQCVDGVCVLGDDTAISCEDGAFFFTSLGNRFVAHLGECGEFEPEEGGAGERPEDWRCGAPMDMTEDCPLIVEGKYVADKHNSRIPPTQLSFAHFASWTGSPTGEKMVMMFKDERLVSCDTEMNLKKDEDGFETSKGTPQVVRVVDVRKWGVAPMGEQAGPLGDRINLHERSQVVINPPTRAMPIPGQPTCGLHVYAKGWDNQNNEDIGCGEGAGPLCCWGYEREEYDSILEYQGTQGGIFEAWGGYGVEIPSVYGTKNNNIVIRPSVEEGDKRAKSERYSGRGKRQS